MTRPTVRGGVVVGLALLLIVQFAAMSAPASATHGSSAIGVDEPDAAVPGPRDLTSSVGSDLTTGSRQSTAVDGLLVLDGKETIDRLTRYIARHVGPNPVLLVTAYSRYDDSNPLEHDVRDEIYRIVTRSPGVSRSAITEETGTPLSTVRYHLRILKAEEIVRSTKIRGEVRFYPSAMDRDDIEIGATFDDDGTARIVKAIARSEPTTVTALADQLDRAPSTVSYHLQRLADAGVVEREQRGRTVLTRLSLRARELQPDDSTTHEKGAPARSNLDE